MLCWWVCVWEGATFLLALLALLVVVLGVGRALAGSGRALLLYLLRSFRFWLGSLGPLLGSFSFWLESFRILLGSKGPLLGGALLLPLLELERGRVFCVWCLWCVGLGLRVVFILFASWLLGLVECLRVGFGCAG